jgi:arsenate reductase
MATRILILCTGNSARSQMAEGFLKSFNSGLTVFSAGTNPGNRVNPFAIRVMKEAGIDISAHRPKDVHEFLEQSFDYVITVCDNARETCPIFVGPVKHRVHLGFEDPAEAKETDDEVTQTFRRIRDEIRTVFRQFYIRSLSRE